MIWAPFFTGPSAGWSGTLSFWGNPSTRRGTPILCRRYTESLKIPQKGRVFVSTRPRKGWLRLRFDHYSCKVMFKSRWVAALYGLTRLFRRATSTMEGTVWVLIVPHDDPMNWKEKP